VEAITYNPETMKNRRDICLANDDFSDGPNDAYEISNDEENFDPNPSSIKTEPQGVLKTKLKDRRSLMKRQGSSRRRRRRSSARFLKIVPDDDEGIDGEGLNYDGISTTNLGEVYRNAIRMNAENRINASNSWNLNLIDHLDRFVAPELRHGAGGGTGGRHLNAMKGGIAANTNSTNNNMMDSAMDSTLVSGVNFTKASCTLDASVKIYSYRVDDIHLTSYKVLANLNRTDNNTTNNGKRGNSANGSDGNGDHSMDDDGEKSGSRTLKSRANTNAVDTLELNTANINIHKLDAAFDIDPLFHKMSKTFDEGGAKGLLLANLGVGCSGCHIVFDSTLDNEDITATSLTMDDEVDEFNRDEVQPNIEEVPPTVNAATNSNSGVDVTSLVGKLESLLSNATGNYSTIENMPLVPQLASLRNQYAELGKDGFVQEVGTSSKRYASTLEDEAEADKSIHLEAIERSRVSLADLGRSHISRASLGTYCSQGDDNYGETGFDYGGDDDDAFGDLHDGNHRFSSSSFAPARVSFSSFGNVDNNPNLELSNTPSTTEPRQSSRPIYSQASVLLDAIASGDISTQQHNHYEYFNSQALKNLSSGNLWAGAEHWKKMPSSRRRKDGSCVKSNDVHDEALTASKKKKGLKGKTKSSSTSKSFSLVSLSTPTENLELMLEKPKLKRGKNVTDPLQFTKALRTKHSNIDNLLPMDAGLGVQEFITLFSRPNVNLVDFVKTKNHDADMMNGSKSAKVVGFCGVDSLGTDDASGTGFDFGGSDDGYDENEDLNEFVVPALEDVRRVDKINIGYAAVARKVDVKRLKRDLWSELEHTFSSRTQNDVQEEVQREEGKEDSENISVYDRDLDDNDGKNNDDGPKVETDNDGTEVSFQDTVRDMQTNQSQSDVTVPFYFICILHLCNEKGLALESSGLDDFVIHSS